MWIKSNVKLTSLLIHPRYLGKNLAQKMFIFCPQILRSLFFARIWIFFFFKYLDVCVGNTLFVHDTPYKILVNGPYNVIFVETFDSFIRDNHNYLLGVVLP